MRKQRVDIVKSIPASNIIEGKQYYYLVDGLVKRGTAVKCEDCGKVCHSNSFTITSFNKPVAKISVAEIVDEELDYVEDLGRCLCSECIPPQISEEAI